MNRCSRFASLLVVSLSALGLFSAGPAPAAELGRVAFVNSGSEEAQEPFQQGVAALHSFFYDEAADLFREAQRRDPGFAMAYWGEALTHNHPLWRQQDRDAALEALGKLAPTRQERAAKAPTERERAYLETVEILYGDGEKHERDVAYREALRRLAERFPDDPEARALHALAIQGAAETAHQTGGADVIPARMESAGILEELFDRHPDHPGVLHYLIHAYDDPVHAPLGLRPARIYAEVAPEANHALHMPSHIFLQLGMWERVVASNEDAVAASEAWVERRGHARDKIDLHSLSWLHYARLQLGQTEAAERSLAKARQVAEEVGSARAVSTRDWMAARHLVELHATEPPVGLPAADETEVGDWPLVSAAALAAWRRGDREALSELAARLRALAENDESTGALAAAARQAEGLALLAAGQRDEAVAALEEAVEIEEHMGPPSGPPDPLQPSHELLGEVLLQLGRPAEAREAFRAALERTPNRTWSVKGLAAAEKGAG